MWLFWETQKGSCFRFMTVSRDPFLCSGGWMAVFCKTGWVRSIWLPCVKGAVAKRLRDCPSGLALRERENYPSVTASPCHLPLHKGGSAAAPCIERADCCQAFRKNWMGTQHLAPLCKGSCREATEGMSPSAFPVTPPTQRRPAMQRSSPPSPASSARHTPDSR